jgi:uncharacterized membrane protein
MQSPDRISGGTLGSGRKRRLTCAISGQQRPRGDLVRLGDLSPSLSERIRTAHPDVVADSVISRNEAARYRRLHVEELLRAEHGELNELDRQVAESLATQETLAENIDAEYNERRTFSERLSDRLSDFGGSWVFIVWFLVAIVLWIGFNQLASEPTRFDPYPYILLNLILSCIAAVQAPIIMMSQKRQEAKDRLRAQNDYQVNLKAELEIRHLHEKIDHLMVRQWQRLAEIQQMQLETMHEMTGNGG